MFAQKIPTILKDHPEMTVDVLKQIPEQIHVPVAVMNPNKNSFVILTELVDKKNNPIIAAIHLNVTHRHIVINKFASAYGKESRETIQRWVDENILYLDKEKASNVSQSLGVQFPIGGTQSKASNKIILQHTDIFKSKISDEEKMAAEYLEAVERKDMETAKKLLDGVRIRNAYNTPKLYRGRRDSGNILYIGKDGGHFTTDKEYASTYAEDGGNIVSGFAYTENPLDLRPVIDQSQSWNDFKTRIVKAGIPLETKGSIFPTAINKKYSNAKTIGEAIDVLESDYSIDDLKENPNNLFTDNLGSVIWPLGYDSIITWEFSDREHPVFILKNPEQFKTSDIVTRDDNENIIPLSQRFDRGKQDVRYSTNREDYQGLHKPPSSENGAPLHDLTGGGNVYPDDVYSANGLRYYGTGQEKADRESMGVIRRMKNKPNAPVTIYRTVGTDADQDTINEGDWVSVSKAYAVQHGESAFGGDYKILTGKAKAKELFTNGDSINEFGYWSEGSDANFSTAQTDTPAFKRWFGDWEAARNKKFLEGEPVVRLTGDEFQKSEESLVRRVSQWFKEQYNNVVNNPEIGDVALNARSVRNSIAHGLGKEKSAAFAAVPNILSNGRVISKSQDWKGRGYDSSVIAAPISIGDEQYVGIAVVIKEQNKNRFYLHEVALTKRLHEDAFKTGASADKSVEPSGASTGVSIKSILQNIFRVNPAETSKVVDENGEPKIVLHATDNNFTVFDSTRSGENTDGNATDDNWAQTSRIGFWFSDHDITKQTAQKALMPVYLDIKNPYRISLDFLVNDVEDAGGGNELQKRLIEDGYDGIIVSDTEFGGESYVAFTPTQIKSATGNSGAFDPANPDIRYSTKDEVRNVSPTLLQQFGLKKIVADFENLHKKHSDYFKNPLEAQLFTEEVLSKPDMLIYDDPKKRENKRLVLRMTNRWGLAALDIAESEVKSVYPLNRVADAVRKIQRANREGGKILVPREGRKNDHSGPATVPFDTVPVSTAIHIIHQKSQKVKSDSAMYSTTDTTTIPDDVKRKYLPSAFAALQAHKHGMDNDGYRQEMIARHGKDIEPHLDAFRDSYRETRKRIIETVQKSRLANPGETPEAKETFHVERFSGRVLLEKDEGASAESSVCPEIVDMFHVERFRYRKLVQWHLAEEYACFRHAA